MKDINLILNITKDKDFRYYDIAYFKEKLKAMIFA
jgi:hypothetical protein